VLKGAACDGLPSWHSLADRAVALRQPGRGSGGCSTEAGLTRSATRQGVTPSAGADGPCRSSTGGPHNVLAATRRAKDWSRPSEPDDLRDEEFWCQPLTRRPYVRFCGVGAAADEGARTETQDIGRGNPPTCDAARREFVTKNGNVNHGRRRMAFSQCGLAVAAASRARLRRPARAGYGP
jgi:hypothetical protein